MFSFTWLSSRKCFITSIVVLLWAVSHDAFASNRCPRFFPLLSSPTYFDSIKYEKATIREKILMIKRGGDIALSVYPNPEEEESLNASPKQSSFHSPPSLFPTTATNDKTQGVSSSSESMNKSSGDNKNGSSAIITKTILLGSTGVISITSSSSSNIRSIINTTIRTIASSIIKTSSSLTTHLTRSTMSCWIVLISAIFVDIWSTYICKVASDTQSVRKLILSLGTHLFSQVLFAGSLSKINVGTAYAIWSALGTAAVSAFGIAFFGEKNSLAKTLCLAMVIGGVIGLNLLDESP
mmetsp:Transcript_9478/g.14007  ORF Transcript_9478/g.14007 Transcript_9478/m.14007 type:complete len:295 (-) Transcript_9478:118-1002(-)